MNICYRNNSIKKIHQIYVFILLVCLFMRYISFYALVPPLLDSILFSSLAIVGFGIITIDIFKIDKLYSYKRDTYLVLFLISLLITSLVNINYGIFQNLKFIVWTAINLLILYSHDKFDDIQETNRKMICFQNILILLWTFMISVSLITYVLGISIDEEVRDNIYFRVGIVEGRLFGVFVNPNTASIIALFVMLFSIFQIFFKMPNALPKTINIISIICQFIYIVLSESRGTTLVLFVCVAIVSFGISYFKLKLSKTNKIIVSLIIAIFSCFLIFLAMKVTDKSFNSIYEFSKSLMSSTKWETNRIIRTKRVDFVENNDISNLRFRIWLSAAEIFKEKWLFGVSPGNVVTYAKQVLPETFIAKRNYMRSHSVWIGIPLYTGIVGAVIMFGFFLKCFLRSLKYCINKSVEKISPMLALKMLIVFLIWVYGLVELEILFVNSVCSFIFWTSLGFVRKHVKF